MGQPLRRPKRPKNQQFSFPSRKHDKNPVATADEEALWDKLKQEWLSRYEIKRLPAGWSRYGF